MSGMNIWDAAVEEVRLNREIAVEKGIVSDKYVLVIGGKSSGKTTAILRFLNRDEAAKPTVALEYTFARRPTQLQGKLTGHIWELGGGTFLTKLLDIPLNVDTLLQMTVIVVLDLSDPKKLWYTAETLLNAARMRLEIVIKQASRQNPSLYQKIKEAGLKRIGGKDHSDYQLIDPFPVPLVIVGAKYDLFQEMDSGDRKAITKAMRFLAHINGSTLMFLSNKNEATIKGLRCIMNHAAFDVDIGKMPSLDTSKPLYVPAGMDSLETIGISTGGRNPMDACRKAFCDHFPQQGDEKKNLTVADDPTNDVQFLEPVVDEARAQKDRELEAYRRQEKNKWTRI